MNSKKLLECSTAIIRGLLTHLFAMTCALGTAAGAFADDDASGSDSDLQSRRNAVARGLSFLEKDAAKWREEKQCSTCHHGTMTVWAYAEARRQGYAVAEQTFRDTTKWTKDRLLERIDLPRDTRPGWSMVSTPAIYLAIMAQSVPGQDVVTDDELKRIADHLVRHQEADGSWAWSSAPAKNRPPPFFESDEVATRLAYMALAPHVPADASQGSAARDSRKKAIAWLKDSPPSDTTQAAVLRLLMKVRDGDSPDTINGEVALLLNRQNKDGGWGQLGDLPSDAYATGQVLFILSSAVVSAEREEVQRAIAFLVANQRDDGSWPMTPRSHAGATPATNTTPITYFGSAWGTLGLLRHVPTSDKSQHAHPNE